MNAVVIPTYCARSTILQVIAGIGPEVRLVIVVDDACPEKSYRVIETECKDPRVILIRNETNLGVGGAFLTGMAEALRRGAEIIIKVDADGQMDTSLIPSLIKPIQDGQADYVKGNRFFFLSNARTMPRRRLFGNLALSFLTKLSTGYWNLMDPSNGFIAIHGAVAALLDRNRISPRFFFESDMLFHLGLLRGKAVDLPMHAIYGQENSNLSISRVFGPFLRGHLRNTFLRILYRYFVRDFSIASIELLVGSLLLVFGIAFGTYIWISNATEGVFTSTGTIMIAAVPLLIGFQLLLAFLNYDIAMMPREPLHPLLKRSSLRLPGPRSVTASDAAA